MTIGPIGFNECDTDLREYSYTTADTLTHPNNTYSQSYNNHQYVLKEQPNLSHYSILKAYMRIANSTPK